MSASVQTRSPPYVSKIQHFLEKSLYNLNKKKLMSANVSISSDPLLPSQQISALGRTLSPSSHADVIYDSSLGTRRTYCVVGGGF